MSPYAFYYSYPFAAVVGQSLAKQALLLNLVNPKIGGVLLCGEKGTSKSTLVRGLESICCNQQVITLPLNTTEDRLVGTLDMEKTISSGVRHFEQGLMGKAHQQILYVDEVNLLSESIVNILLEVSGTGRCCVEREGLSRVHEASFTLVGTMNPEEGQLRSQWLDRFGLYVEIEGSASVVERKEIMRRRLHFEKNPLAFCEEWSEATMQLREQIAKANQLLPKVQVYDQSLQLAVEMALTAQVAGHRSELVLIETAKSIAALDGRTSVNLEDLKAAAAFVFPHRKRENDSQQMASENREIEENKSDEEPTEASDSDNKEDAQQTPNTENRDDQTLADTDMTETTEQADNWEDSAEPELESKRSDHFDEDSVFEVGRIFQTRALPLKLRDRKKRRGDGKRLHTKTDQCKGQYIRNRVTHQQIRDFAFDATLRAAAPYQNQRRQNGLAIAIQNSDFRDKVREKRTGSTILFTVDASASMGVKKRMTAVKGAILSLLTDAYQKRDKVGLIAFRKDKAEVVLDITRSVNLAQRSLASLPTGGRTPLAAGLMKAYATIVMARRKEPDMVPIVVLVSDGRTNVAVNGGDPFAEALNWIKIMAADGIQMIVIDSEQDFIKLELARQMAEAINCLYFRLEDLEADSLAQAVRESIA